MALRMMDVFLWESFDQMGGTRDAPSCAQENGGNKKSPPERA
jgi:hypothetical protein